jgi:hypothetical protein
MTSYHIRKIVVCLVPLSLNNLVFLLKIYSGASGTTYEYWRQWAA